MIHQITHLQKIRECSEKYYLAVFLKETKEFPTQLCIRQKAYEIWMHILFELTFSEMTVIYLFINHWYVFLHGNS